LGLTLGEESYWYRKFLHGMTHHFGQKGCFKLRWSILFWTKNILFNDRKFFNGLFMIIKWKTCTDYFRVVNFEFKPLLLNLYRGIWKKQQGPKLKSARFSLQILNEIQLPSVKKQPYRFLLRQQSMDLFNQPNVKGWDELNHG
jgi:hypothetical protein